MPAPGLLRLQRAYERIPYWPIAALARLLVGLVFFRSGLTKVDLPSLSVRPSTFFLFEQEYKIRLPQALGLTGSELTMPFPHAAAYAGSVVEIVVPLLVWAGLGARVAASLLLAQTLVIETVYPDAYVEHGLWAVALLMLMRFGPGALSLDRVLGLEAEST